MTQMPPDSIVNEESFKKVMEHVYRDRIMISGVDAARLIQTYLITEKEKKNANKTSDKIRRHLEGVKAKAAKATRVKASKVAKAKARARGRAKHSEVK